MIQIDKKIIFLSVGRLAQVLLAIISIRLLTGLMTQKEVGHQYVISSLVLWFSLVLVNPLGMFVNRHLHEWRSKNIFHFYIKEMNKYFLLVALISLPIVFVLRNYLNVGQFLSNIQILLFILLYIYLSTWFQTLVSFFNLFEFQLIFVSLNIISQVLGLFFAWIFVLLISPTAIAWMSGLLIGQIISLLIAIYFFKIKFKKIQCKPLPKDQSLFTLGTLAFCVPIAITTFFMWFVSQGYRLIVDRTLGVEIVASLGVGLSIAASLASVVESVVSQYFFPKYYATLSNADSSQRNLAWNQLWRNTMVLYIPSFFLILSTSILVVKVLTSIKFYHVVPYVWYGAGIELFRQLSNITYLVSHAEKKTKYAILPYLIGGIFLVVTLKLSFYFDALTTDIILMNLLLTSFLIYLLNLIIVKKLINSTYDYKIITKAIVFSMPLLLPNMYVNINSNILILVTLALSSAMWYFICLYYLLKSR